jgi:hypothetical protein
VQTITCLGSQEEAATDHLLSPTYATTAAARFPGETQARPASRAGSLAPMKTSAMGRKSQQASVRSLSKTQGQSDEVSKEIYRPHTSLGFAREGDEAVDASLLGGTNSINSVDVGAKSTLADLKASWTMSGAGSTDSIEEPPELKASRFGIFRCSARHYFVD